MVPRQRKNYNDTYRTITRILQNRKKLTDEMKLRFKTAKPLEKNTFVLITNQQQIDGVSTTTKDRTLSYYRQTHRNNIHIKRQQ